MIDRSAPIDFAEYWGIEHPERYELGSGDVVPEDHIFVRQFSGAYSSLDSEDWVEVFIGGEEITGLERSNDLTGTICLKPREAVGVSKKAVVVDGRPRILINRDGKAVYKHPRFANTTEGWLIPFPPKERGGIKGVPSRGRR